MITPPIRPGGAGAEKLESTDAIIRLLRDGNQDLESRFWFL